MIDSPYVIDVKNLNKSFDVIHAIINASLQVKRVKYLVLLNPITVSKRALSGCYVGF